MRSNHSLAFVAILTLCATGWAGDILRAADPDASGRRVLPDGTTATYAVTDTGQVACFDAEETINPPEPGSSFFGQDAQYIGLRPDFAVSADRLTVRDLNTGLTWTRSPDTDGDGDIDSDDKKSWAELPGYAADLNEVAFGGFDDWRIPTIKELYSLMDFRGTDPAPETTNPAGLVPFIDTQYFDFGYGDVAAGERLIDAQYWSSTEYVSTTMGGAATVFGVNFADGRIKGYPRDFGPAGAIHTRFVRLVRGNPSYGLNNFVDNGDGTVADLATGLIWQQADSGVGMTWEAALAYAENLELAGHSDWRLPDVKELQSLIDYTRSPDTTTSAAIDPIFAATAISNEDLATDFPFYWTGTTHERAIAISSGRNAAYLSFGRGMGYMSGSWMDVHGAGCQRSDPKGGDLSSYTYVPHGYYLGQAPQGDAIRILNFVRCVREGGVEAVSLFSSGFEDGDTSGWLVN
jgi:hypothetical protein